MLEITLRVCFIFSLDWPAESTNMNVPLRYSSATLVAFLNELVSGTFRHDPTCSIFNMLARFFWKLDEFYWLPNTFESPTYLTDMQQKSLR